MKFELHTERLVLKVLNTDSADKVLNFYKKNADIFELYEPLLGDDFYTLDHHKKILEFEYKNIMSLNMVRYWLFDANNSSTIIGTVSLRNIIRPIYSCCTIGYKMDRDYMNKGLMTEALNCVIPHAISELGLHRFEALVLPDNAPSISLLKKIGFQQEGLLRDKILIGDTRKDHLMYSYIANN